MITHAIADALVSTRQVLRREALRDLPGEAPEVIWVVEPRREPDTTAELLVADAYKAASFGRHCVPVFAATDKDGRPCLARRYRSDWRTFASLARPEGAGWVVDLPASLLRRDAARIALLDYLLANPNRHGHSLLLDLEGRRILSGDHSSCLGNSGPTLESCRRAGPLGDLGLTDDEMEQALSWWEGAQWAALPVLGQHAEAVKRRLGLLLAELGSEQEP